MPCSSPSTATGFFTPRGPIADGDNGPLELGFSRSMALVAHPPPNVWRDSNLTAGGNLQPYGSTVDGFSPALGVGVGGIGGSLQSANSTDLKQETAHSAGNSSHSNSLPDSGSPVEKKDHLECVVCGDKSSGKHYGQFTCEGKKFLLF